MRIRTGRTPVHVSYWLIPEQSSRGPFAEVIGQLAGLYDAPSFEPHATVYSGPGTTDEGRRVVESVAENHQPITLRARGVDFTGEYTKTLFLEFQSAAEAAGLCEDIRASVSYPSTYILRPHLSLIYKRLAAGEQEKIVNTLSELPDLVVFDHLQAVLTPATVTDRSDVEGWEVLADRPLGNR